MIDANDYITGDAFRVEPTAEGWWETVPAPRDLGRYYPALYFGKPGRRRFPGPVEWGQSLLYRDRARRITSALGRTGVVLDVGCGPGHLLARFRRLGWTVLGTEADEMSAIIPRERYGIEVRAGELTSLQLASGGYDAIVSWHSLEHMRDPGAVLDEFVRLLKPGGVLIVAVPNFGSSEAQAMPRAWFHLDVPRHLCHFPADVLRAQLERRRLIVESVRYGAPEYDAFSLVQTWQNRIGLPHNLLYLQLKSEPGPAGTDPTFTQRSTAWVLGALMLPAAVVVAGWRAWRLDGAVVEILARKPI